MEARKITFQEAWNSTSIFFIDDTLEEEINAEVDRLLKAAVGAEWIGLESGNGVAFAEFLARDHCALNVILREIELSEEKFMRIVSLLRKIGRIPGGFDVDSSEWNIARIKREIANSPLVANVIAYTLMDGKRDTELAKYIPQYYLDTLNYREIMGSSPVARKIRYKRSLIGTYSGRKGYRVEQWICAKLEEIREKHGISYGKGRSRIIGVDIDFAIPSIEDPWVIIMSSFQETTSSGQTTKARDMLAAYIRIIESNSRNREDRAFVNFVDGGGWLARKLDFKRLVEQCHYFINLQYLDMIEPIVLRHVPSRYYLR